jgi:hypothetical protein
MNILSLVSRWYYSIVAVDVLEVVFQVNLALTPNPSPKLGRGEPEPQVRAG